MCAYSDDNLMTNTDPLHCITEQDERKLSKNAITQTLLLSLSFLSLSIGSLQCNALGVHEREMCADREKS